MRPGWTSSAADGLFAAAVACVLLVVAAPLGLVLWALIRDLG